MGGGRGGGGERGGGGGGEGGGWRLPVEVCNVVVRLWKHRLERDDSLVEGERFRRILRDKVGRMMGQQMKGFTAVTVRFCGV